MASEENIGKLYRIAQEEHGERINYESFRESLMRSISADLDIDEMIIKMLESSEGVSIGTYKNGVFVFSNEVIKTAEKLVIEDAKKKDIYETDDKIDVDVTKEIIKETQPKESRLTGFAQMSLEQQLEIIADFKTWTSDDLKVMQEGRRKDIDDFPKTPDFTKPQREAAKQFSEFQKIILDTGLESFETFSKITREFQESFDKELSREEFEKMHDKFLEVTRKMLKDNFNGLQNPKIPEKYKKLIYKRLAKATGMESEDIQETLQEMGYNIEEWINALDNIILSPLYEKDGVLQLHSYTQDLTDCTIAQMGAFAKTTSQYKTEILQMKDDPKKYQKFEQEDLFGFYEAAFQTAISSTERYKREVSLKDLQKKDEKALEIIPQYGANVKLAFRESVHDIDNASIKKFIQPPPKGRIFKKLQERKMTRHLKGKQEAMVDEIGQGEVADKATGSIQGEKLVTDKELRDRLMANISKPLYQDITFTERVLRTPQTLFPTTYKSSTETLEAVLKKSDKIPMAGLPGLKYTPTNVTRFNPLVVETMVVDTEPLKFIQPKTKTVQETPVPPVVEEVVTEPIEEPYVSKPNMSEANVVPTPPAAEVVEPENVQEEPETALPANITLGDKLKRGFNALGDKMKAVFAAIVSNDKSKGLFARVSDALAGSAGSSDATSTSSTSSAGQGKEAQVVDYLNQHFDINVKAARDAAIASQEAAAKETKAVDEKGDETK